MGGTLGIVQFGTRQEALEACMECNGVNLEGSPLRLRQDRGEFFRLRSEKRARTESPDAGPPWHPRAAAEAAAANKANTRDIDCKVYVGNLSYKTTWQALKDHMRQCGDV